jgi:hypothetical protein
MLPEPKAPRGASAGVTGHVVKRLSKAHPMSWGEMLRFAQHDSKRDFARAKAMSGGELNKWIEKAII